MHGQRSLLSSRCAVGRLMEELKSGLETPVLKHCPGCLRARCCYEPLPLRGWQAYGGAYGVAAAPEASPQPAASQESARESAPATAADSGRAASFGGGDAMLPAKKRGRGAAVTSRRAPALAPSCTLRTCWRLGQVAALKRAVRVLRNVSHPRAGVCAWWACANLCRVCAWWACANLCMAAWITCVLHPFLGLDAGCLGLEVLDFLHGGVSSGRGRDMQPVQSNARCLT